VDTITRIEDLHNTDRILKAENLITETKILNIARLAKMLVDLFGSDEPFQKIGKREGQEIEMYLKDLDSYITFVLTTDRKNFDCRVEKADNPVSRIIMRVKEEKIVKTISSIIRSKNNLYGLIKLLKYIIPRKIRIKGSYIAAIKLVKCLMIGKHYIYKEGK
jgi:hypothetical protein